MEFILGLITGLFSSWYFLITAVVLGITFEHNEEHGFAVFFGALTALSAHFIFDIPFDEVLVWAVLYFAVGVFWSFWRYRQFVVERKNWSSLSEDYLKPSNHTDRIVSWIIIWPFSAIENLTSDLLELLKTFVTKTLKGIYERIYRSAMGI